MHYKSLYCMTKLYRLSCNIKVYIHQKSSWHHFWLPKRKSTSWQIYPRLICKCCETDWFFQYLVCRPFAFKQASILFGILAYKFSISWDEAQDRHAVVIASRRSSFSSDITVVRTWCFSRGHTCSIMFKSGEFDGHSMSCSPFSSIHSFTWCF